MMGWLKRWIDSVASEWHGIRAFLSFFLLDSILRKHYCGEKIMKRIINPNFVYVGKW
jgi:hypothetical protein